MPNLVALKFLRLYLDDDQEKFKEPIQHKDSVSLLDEALVAIISHAHRKLNKMEAINFYERSTQTILDYRELLEKL